MLTFALHLTIIALLAAGVETACRLGRFRASICHALWLVVLVKLLVPPVVSWPLPTAVYEAAWTETALGGEAKNPAAPTKPSGMPENAPRAMAASAAHANTMRVDVLALCLWLAGSLFYAGMVLRRYVRFRRALGPLRPLSGAAATAAHSIAATMGMPCPRVYLAAGLPSPIAVGIARPRVIVPEWLAEGLTLEGWRGVLAHELAHVKRRDIWCAWAQWAALSVWWWNPAAWLVCRRLNGYAELACDAWAVTLSPERRRDYAETLLRVAARAAATPLPAPCLHSAAGTHFGRRIRALFSCAGDARAPRRVLAAVALAALLAIPGWSRQIVHAAPAPPPTVLPAASTPLPPSPNGRFADFRIYVTRAQTTPAESTGKPAIGRGEKDDMSSLTIASWTTFASISSGLVRAGSQCLESNGGAPVWNGESVPSKGDVALLAAPAVPLVFGKKTEIQVPLSAEYATFLGLDRDWELTLRCEPIGMRELSFSGVLNPQGSITPSGGGDTVALPSTSSASFNWKLPIARDGWKGLMTHVCTAKHCLFTLIALYRETDEAGTHIAPAGYGTYTCAMAEGSYPASGEVPAQYSVTLAYCTGAPEEVRRATETMTPLPIAGLDAGVMAFTPPAPRSGEKTDLTALLGAAKLELISAPRVTFMLESRKLVSRQQVAAPPDDPISALGLREFFDTERGQAIIADIASGQLPSGSMQHWGFALAIAAHATATPEVFDMAIKTVAREPRYSTHGALFWKKQRLEGFDEAVKILRFPSKLDDTIVFQAPAPKPEVQALYVFTMEQVSEYIPPWQG